MPCCSTNRFQVSLPLNLHQNAAHPYHPVLSALRLRLDSSQSFDSLHGFTLLSLDSRFHFTDFLFQESLRLGLARGEKLPSVYIPFLSPVRQECPSKLAAFIAT